MSDTRESADDSDEGVPISGMAPSPPDWVELIATAVKTPERVFSATTYHSGPWPSFSKPVCVQCEDKTFRVIKYLNRNVTGRTLFNDHVVARLAQLIGAPVPRPALVHLSQELRDAEPRLADTTPGVCHGCEFHPGYGDRLLIADHSALPENRDAFARLAALYGWAHAGDHQQIYPLTPPFKVLSVDHGHFIGDQSPDWTPATLLTNPPPEPDALLVGMMGITKAEIQSAVAQLGTVTPEDIARAVAHTPAAWGISEVDRKALAEYFWNRCQVLLKNYPVQVMIHQPEAAGE